MEPLLPSPSWALMGSQVRFLLLWSFFCHQHSTFHIFSVPGLDPFFLSSLSLLHSAQVSHMTVPHLSPSRLWCFPRLSSRYTSAAVWVSLICKGLSGTEMLLARRQGLMASEHLSIWNWFWPLYIFWYKETDTAKNNRWAAGRIISLLYPEETRFYFWALQTLSWLKILYFFQSSSFISVLLFCFCFQIPLILQGSTHMLHHLEGFFDLSVGGNASACSQGLPYGPLPQCGSVAAGFSVILLSTQLSVP